MKFRKLLYAAFTGVMAVSTAFCVQAVTALAQEPDPVPLAYYDFNDGMAEGPRAIVTGLSDYKGDVTFAQGRSAEEADQAIELGEYGLKMNQQNI